MREVNGEVLGSDRCDGEHWCSYAGRIICCYKIDTIYFFPILCFLRANTGSRYSPHPGCASSVVHPCSAQLSVHRRHPRTDRQTDNTAPLSWIELRQ